MAYEGRMQLVPPKQRKLIRLVCAATISASAVAIGASKVVLAQPKTFDGFYKGSLECEQMTAGGGASRVPLSIFVRDGTVMALYDSDDRRTGPIMPAGRIDPHGVFRLGNTSYTSDRSIQRDYSGTINGSDGTLTDTQVLTRKITGDGGTRTCKGTLLRVELPRQ